MEDYGGLATPRQDVRVNGMCDHERFNRFPKKGANLGAPENETDISVVSADLKARFTEWSKLSDKPIKSFYNFDFTCSTAYVSALCDKCRKCSKRYKAVHVIGASGKVLKSWRAMKACPRSFVVRKS